jgi:hypothetical protein
MQNGPMDLPSRINLCRSVFIVLAGALIAATGACDAKRNADIQAPAPPPVRTFVSGVEFSADPNPIPVCDASGTGVTTLRWNAPCPPGSFLEVRVGGVNGKVFARVAGRSEAPTGKWVSPGLAFSLLRGTTVDGERVVLAELTVRHTTNGCK